MFLFAKYISQYWHSALLNKEYRALPIAAMKVGSQSTPCMRLLLLRPELSFSSGEWRKSTPRVPPCSLTTDDRSYSWCYQGLNCHQKMFVIFLKKSSFGSPERPVVSPHVDGSTCCHKCSVEISTCSSYQSLPLSVVKAMIVFS